MASLFQNARLLLLIGFIALAQLAYSATITSTKDGNWNAGSTWIGGVVPSASDDVVINSGDFVTVTANASCNSVLIENVSSLDLAGASGLKINSGVTLDVANDFLVDVVVGTLGTTSTVNILGTLTIGGNCTLNCDLSVLGGTNAFTIGDATNSGDLSVQGDLNFTNSLISALGTMNQLELRNGNISVYGEVVQTAGVIGLLSTNKLIVNDDGAYDGLTKTFYFGGTGMNLSSGTISIEDANANGAIDFHYIGTSPQLLETNNITYRNVHIENTDNVYLDAQPTNSNIIEDLIIEDGGTLIITDGNNLDALTGASDKVQLKNGGRLLLTAPAFPSGIPVNTLTSESLGIVEFQNNSGSAATIFQESVDYPIVQLTGVNEKQYTSSSNEIDDSSTKVGRLELLEGTLSIDNGLDLELNTIYGDGTFLVDSATTVQVEGNFSNLSAYGDFHRYSTWEYNKSGQMQKVYSFTTNGTTPEPYGILKLSTASGVNVKRDVDADIQIENNLQIGSQITLNLKANAYVHLLSDSSFTAFVKEINTTGSITYNGASAIIAYKYLYFSGYSAPDISTTMQVQRLSMVKNAGIQMRGFPGSNKPANKYSSVSTYTESDTGNVNQGFNKPSSIDDTILQRNGSNKITKSAYRINVDPGTYLLLDTGEINLKEQTLELTFNHDTLNNTAFRTSADGYNFVGNPYAAPLNWNAIVNDPDNAAIFASGVSSTFYVYKYFDRVNEEPGGSGGYGYYNASTKDEYAQDSIIPAHQGFWIKTYNASSFNETFDLKIKESHKMDFEQSRNYKSKKRGGKKINKGLIHFENKTGQADEIFFNYFDKATTGYDTRYDIPRFGSPSASNPFVEFANADGIPLGIYVNAIGQESIGQELPLYINAPTAGAYTLSFSQISTFLSTYPCISVKDLVSGKTYKLENTLDIDFTLTEPYKGVRFLLQFIRTNEDLIETEDISCYGVKDGTVTLPLNTLIKNHSYSLWQNNVIVQEQSGPIDTLHFTALKAGNYVLRNNTASGGLCEFTNSSITINSPEKLITAVSISSTTINLGSSVHVDITGTAQAYSSVIANTTYTATTFDHTFTSAGKYTLTVNAKNENKTCSEDQAYDIEVLNTTGINEHTVLAYSIIKGNLVFSNANFKELAVYSLEGKLLKTYFNQQSIPLEKGVNIYRITAQDLTNTTLKISFQ